MATFTKPHPDADVHAFLGKAIDKWHPDLAQAEVSVGILAAWPGENDDAALKLHGYPCAAVVKITPYRQRVQGIEDAVITIAGPTWKDLSDAEKLALIDHELVHLEVARDNEGQIKADDHGRPKLRMRLHDWNLGGFEVIAERHGAAALESQMFRQAHRTYYQAVFSWADDQAPQDQAPDLDLKANGKAPHVLQDASAAPPVGDPTSGADPSWRSTTIGAIGFADRTVEILDERVIPTAGEVVVVMRQDPDAFGVQVGLDISDCMDRFRNRLSPGQVVDFDACRSGGEAPAPVVARKAKGSRTATSKGVPA